MTTLQDASPKLGMRDKLLPVWIGLAMAAGLLLGTLAPGLEELLAGATVGGVSVPIALGVPSGQALAGLVGPLIEVPVLVALVWVALRARQLFQAATSSAPGAS